MNLDSSLSASSPDPLALSPPSSPLKRDRISSPLRRASGSVSIAAHRSTTPSQQMSSPAKTITLSTGKSAGSKPWTIKVTVEAEPEGTGLSNENQPPLRDARTPPRRGRTVKIPLRDHDTSVGKAKPRPGTPAGRNKRRASTPTRRKRRSITNVDSDEDTHDDSRDQDFAPQPRARRARRKTSISKLIFDDQAIQREDSDLAAGPGIMQDEEAQVTQEEEEQSLQQDDGPTTLSEAGMPSPPTFSSLSPPNTINESERDYVRSSPPAHHVASGPSSRGSRMTSEGSIEGLRVSHEATAASPERLPTNSTRPTFRFTKLAPANGWSAPASNAHVAPDETTSRFQDLLSESEEEIEPTEGEVGEQTMLDGEGFSMISLESLESARDMLHLSSPRRSEPSRPHGKDAQAAKQDEVNEVVASTVEEHPSGLLTPSSSSACAMDVDTSTGAAAIACLEQECTSKPVTPGAKTQLQPQVLDVKQRSAERPRMKTPEIKQVAAASQRLQSVVNSAQRPTVAAKIVTPERVEDESLFHGFSANTRRQLRESLHFGEELAKRAPGRDSLQSAESPSLSIPRPPDQTVEIQYPSMSPRRSSASLGPDVPASAHTSRSNVLQPSCISPDSMEARWQQETASRSRQENESKAAVPVFQALEKPHRSLLPLRTESDQAPALLVANVHTRASKQASQHLALSEKPITFWQPGTSLAALNSAKPPASSSRRTTSGFRRAGSGSSAGSSTPTPSPPPEEIRNNDGDSAGTSESTSPSHSSEDGSVVSDDTGMFWHRNLPGVYAKQASTRPSLSSSLHLKSDKIDLSSLLKLQTPVEISPLRTPGRGLSSPMRAVSAMTVLTPGRAVQAQELRGVLKTPGSPAKVLSGSPSKSATRVSFADFDEINAFSIDGTTESDASAGPEESAMSLNDTMTSDARQLHEEMDSSDSQLIDEAESETEQVIDGSGIDDLSRSVSQHSVQSTVASEVDDETFEDEQEQERDEVEDGDASESVEETASSVKSGPSRLRRANGYSEVDVTTVDDAQAAPTRPAPSLAGRFSAYVWSFVPTTEPAPASQLSHPILRTKSLSLLPRVEPWTRTHYLTLDRLYQKLQRHPELFHPEHPDNVCLAPVIAHKQRYCAGPSPGLKLGSFADWDGVVIKNWGYTVTLATEHIVLAALYSQLLALKSIDVYEELVGRKIDIGECCPGKVGQEISFNKVLMRVFSLIHGQMVRRDEKKGLPIDRSKGNGWMKFKGSKEWINYM